MPETIASANIEINLDDEAVVSGLRRIDREFERTVNDINRTRAVASMDLKTAPFEDAVANVKREIKKLEADYITKTIEIDKKEYDKKMRALRKELKDVEGQKATIELDVKGEEKVLKAQERIRKAAEAEARAIEKREAARNRTLEQAEARRLAGIRQQGRVQASLWKQQEREMSAARTQAERIDRLRDKELADIPKMQREYAELTQKIELLAQAKRKAARDEVAVVTIDFKIAEAEAKMIALNKTLERLGSPVDLSVNIRPGKDFGKAVREAFLHSGATGAAYVAGMGMGTRMVEGFAATFNPKALLGSGKDVLGRIARAFGSLSEATVRLGPFTATIRQALVGLSVLGPVVVSLVGALGSLVGVMGTGLVGAAALGAGALGAFGVSLGGIGLLIPTLLRDFKNLTSFQDAYHKAVLKFGEGSDQAKSKLKQFNHALGEVQPTTRTAFQNLDNFRDYWNRLAQDVKPQFFDAMAQGFMTVNHHIKWFAKNTKAAFTEAGAGWKAWMEGLRGDEAGRILKSLGDAGNASIRPLMGALGNIATMFGRIAESAARFLPGMVRNFEAWTKSLKDSDALTGNLNSNIDRLVGHAASLGKFLKAAGGFLVSFFDAGADSGKSFLDTMTAALNRWTEFNRGTGREDLAQFFERSVKGAQALYKALKPIVESFVIWAAEMAPLITVFMQGVGAITDTVGALLKLTGLQGSISAVVTTLGALWAVGRIKAATRAVQGFGGALLGLKGPAAAAGGINVAGGLGAGGRIIGPAERTMANAIKTTAISAAKGAGLIGVGIMAMQLIGKGMKTAADRGGASSTMLGLSRDVLSTFSGGIISSAEESSKAAAQKVVGALRKNVNLELDKNIKLGGGTSTLDLTVSDKKLARSAQEAMRVADRIVANHKLPDLKATVTLKSNPQDFKTIERNFNKLQQNLVTSTAGIRKNTTDTMEAIKNSMGLNSDQGKRAVEKNMGLTALAITRSMARGGTSAKEGMQGIREQFRVHSQASKRSSEVNFGAAKTAIQMAAKDGLITTKQKLQAIRALWVEYLTLYGFTEAQAKNISKGNSYTGGPEEGTRGPGRSGTARRKARGGLTTVGRKGERGMDNVPAMLNGQPSIVARGEQVAVFNRHQQKEMDQRIPGGLEGFFAGNSRPHYMARGGIVPVPGFPGEMAAASILDEIAMVSKTFGLVLTDAYGQGHKSPGHTIYGTAADFAGPDASMDAAVKALVAAGYLVGYDGRYGSADWPGHGPASGQGGGNAHLHVEFGGKGGAGGIQGVEAQTIKRQMAAQGLGAVTIATQQVLDTVLAAAQQNLDNVAAQSLTVATGGGFGVGPGHGAATRAEMTRWATQALNATSSLGHGGATPGNIAKILTLAMKESSWIVDSINNWDSNAKAGNPSGGLMHVTIDKVGGSRERLFDPVANMIASIKYQMSRYHGLITHSPYAMGGLVDVMPENMWARGGKIDRPTLMTGEDGRKSPEYVVGTNPRFKRTNLQALTNAASALGVPMARKSKTGTVKPTLVNPAGKDVGNLSQVKHYTTVQEQESDQRRKISIAESRVKEPESLVKQQGTDAAGNPLYVIDQTVVNAYAKQLGEVRALYNELIGLKPGSGIMGALGNAAQAAFAAIDRYRSLRTQNIANLDEANRVNQRLTRSKDKHTAQAAKRRLDAGLAMREEEVGKRNDAASVKQTIVDDQKDAGFRRQEYEISRQSVVDDISGLGAKAAAAAASETAGAYKEPETGPAGPTAGAGAVTRLETEKALAEAGFGMTGIAGTQRDLAAINADLIAANKTVIAEAQAMLTDADVTNDQAAYEALTSAANAIKGLQEEISSTQSSVVMQGTVLSTAMRDLYTSFGGNFSLAQSGLAGGRQVAAAMGRPVSFGAPAPIASAAGGGGGLNVVINQNFPTQPDPMTWAVATRYELNAAL